MFSFVYFQLPRKLRPLKNRNTWENVLHKHFPDIQISYRIWHSPADNLFCNEKRKLISYHSYCCLSKVDKFKVLHFSFVHAPACANCKLFLNYYNVKSAFCKLANCMLYINMYSLSALYMLRFVLIVKVLLVIVFKKKKKKKEKRKTTRTSVWVKILKLCHKNPRYLSFLWEREGILCLQLYKN